VLLSSPVSDLRHPAGPALRGAVRRLIKCQSDGKRYRPDLADRHMYG